MRESRDFPRTLDRRLASAAESLCPRCGSNECQFCWQTFVNGTRHIRVTCVHCHSFVKYAPQTAINIGLADSESSAKGGQL